MRVIVKGVSVALTKQQVQFIETELRRRAKYRTSFKRMLTSLGFKEDTELPGSFSHKKQDWYAQINDRGNWNDCWMTGPGLKDASGFPGGWIYETPKEIEQEIIRALQSEQQSTERHES